VEADIPGFKKEDIKIDVTPETVEIIVEQSEEKKEEKEGKFLRQERCAYRFYRTISLLSSVDTEKIDTSFKDGTLTLTLPKTPGTGKKRITL
jgi:HSP20 family protein